MSFRPVDRLFRLCQLVVKIDDRGESSYPAILKMHNTFHFIHNQCDWLSIPITLCGH